MFTGIIKHIGKVVENIQEGDGRVLSIFIPNLSNQNIGDSISISGCCLTIIKIESNIFTFYVSAETLKQTTLALFTKGQNVNAESAMLASTPFGGHMVLGHIDEVAKVIEVSRINNTFKVFLQISYAGTKYVIKKGSITIDGISLTIMDVKNKIIELNIIPHTLLNTTLQNLNSTTNSLVNVEFDHFSKIISKKIEEHFKGM